MCNPLHKALVLFFSLPHRCCPSLSLCEVNHTGRIAKIVITPPVNSSACTYYHMYCAPAVWTPGNMRPSLTKRWPPTLLVLPRAWLQPTDGQINHPPPPITMLLPYSTGFWCSQTQSAHLASNQTIPKIDKQLRVRMDMQMGREGDRQREWNSVREVDRSVTCQKCPQAYQLILTQTQLSMFVWSRVYIHLSDI